MIMTQSKREKIKLNQQAGNLYTKLQFYNTVFLRLSIQLNFYPILQSLQWQVVNVQQ